MPSTFDFAAWPPKLSGEQLETLTLHAKTYALSNGHLYLPPFVDRQPLIPSAAIHAPFSLFPSPFPRRLFEKARRMQKAYNILYARIAMNEDFLDNVMGAEVGLGKVDEFIGQLWRGWKQSRDAGLAQPIHLGLFRSDYLLHSPPGSGNNQCDIKQVEFNTIAASFAGLSQKTTALHQYLQSATNYFNSSPYLQSWNLPVNESIGGLASGLAAAHSAYGVKGSQILFVVQPGERNVFDQRLLEYELLERHSIKCIRRTLDGLEHSASVDSSSSVLRIVCPPDIDPSGLVEISTVYYRAGYSLHEYPTAGHFKTRFLLERSRAIKCPTIALQLAGGKKVQQVLTRPGVLEHFLANEEQYGKAVLSPTEIGELRDSFMEMWGLDVGEDMFMPDGKAAKSGEEEFGVGKARENALSLVLKPQREGGGNNIYKEAIPTFLDALPPKERKAWIAMRLIQPPDTGNYLVRAGSTTDLQSELPVKAETISELGIYGWALFGGSDDMIHEREAGWLLRTKGKENNEGGVANGFSVLDSPLLID